MNAATLGRHLDQWFTWTWHTSVYASVLILLVWLVQGLLGRRLSASWRFAFGILVVVRLLIPDVPATRFSLFNLAGRWSDAKVRQPVAQDLYVPSTASQPSLSAVNFPRVPVTTRRPLDVMLVVRVLWLAGCAGSLLLVFGQHLRFAAWARRQQVVTDPPAIALLQSCRKLLDVRRDVRMILSPRLGTPAVFGFFRPILLLPSGLLERMSAPELRLVFLHELVHVRRGDVLLNWAVILARALHWFNPLAWSALSRFRADQELACDARVLAHLAVDERRLYGHTLLNLVTQHTRVPDLPGLVPLIHKKSDIERRIKMIATFQPARRSASLASAAVFLVIGSLTMTRAAIENSASPPGTFAAGEKPPPVASSDYLDAVRIYGLLAAGDRPPLVPASPGQALNTYEQRIDAFARKLQEYDLQIHNAETNLERLGKELKVSDEDKIYLARQGGFGPQSIVHYESLRIENEVSYIKLSKQLNQLLQLNNSADLRQVIPTLSPDPLLQDLLQKLSDAQTQLVTLKGELGEQHPDVTRVSRLVNELNSQVDARVKGDMMALENQVNATLAVLQELEKKISESNADDMKRAKELRSYFQASAELDLLKKIRDIIKIRSDQEIIERALPKALPHTLTLQVHQDGSLRLNQPSGETKDVTLEQLKNILNEQGGKDPETLLMIVADKSTTAGQVSKALEAAQAAKIGKINLRTE